MKLNVHWCQIQYIQSSQVCYQNITPNFLEIFATQPVPIRPLLNGFLHMPKMYLSNRTESEYPTNQVSSDHALNASSQGRPSASTSASAHIPPGGLAHPQPWVAANPSEGRSLMVDDTAAFPAEAFPAEAFPAEAFPAEACPAEACPAEACPEAAYLEAAYPVAASLEVASHVASCPATARPAKATPATAFPGADWHPAAYPVGPCRAAAEPRDHTAASQTCPALAPGVGLSRQGTPSAGSWAGSGDHSASAPPSARTCCWPWPLAS
jgi:hypothetical protein